MDMIKVSAVDVAYQYIFGPVFSWRLGRSLGVDPISPEKKTCNMNCVYCQLGETALFSNERKEYVPTQAIIDEIKSLPPISIDYITLSSCGEPTLASNLGEIIQRIRLVRPEKIAVITNSILMRRPDVRQDLARADVVMAKLDAPTQEIFDKIHRPLDGIRIQEVIEGIKSFRRDFNGKISLQMMFITENMNYGKPMADLARTIKPDEIEINTPLRPSAVSPLSREQIDQIKGFFQGLPVRTVYEHEGETCRPLNGDATKKRHGDFD